MNADQDKIIGLIKDDLKRNYQPLKLFLYGSRSDGTYSDESDYDFVMVVSDFESSNRLDTQLEIAKWFRLKLGVDVQVWIYSLKDFSHLKNEFSSIPETASSTGKEIPLG